MEKNKKEYTIKELCSMYNVTSMTVLRLRKRGLPYIKRGRNVFFEIEEVEKWLRDYNKAEKYNYEYDDKETPVN